MKWEYYVVDVPLSYEGADRRLNELGEQGWELVSVIVEGDYDGGGQHRYAFLKRSKSK
jgi:hypothetical protein